MTRDELLELLLIERYGPRRRRSERRQERAVEPVMVPHFSDTPRNQARRRAALAAAIDSTAELTEGNVA